MQNPPPAEKQKQEMYAKYCIKLPPTKAKHVIVLRYVVFIRTWCVWNRKQIRTTKYRKTVIIHKQLQNGIRVSYYNILIISGQ